jgi:hypothetical protein
LPFSVDVGAPKPIANAWQIDSTTADNNGVFTLGDEIKLTLSIDEAVTLAKVGRNKIVIAGKEFLLTGTNGTLTNTLVFAYTVKINGVTKLGNNIAVINKAFGRCNIGIPAGTRDFFINTIG